MAKKTTARKAPAKAKEPHMDAQSGMDPGPAAADRKRQTEAKFAEADAKGKPETAAERAEREAEEARVGQQVRGY